MANNIRGSSVADIGLLVRKFLNKFHIFIFFLIISGGLAYALVSLGTIIVNSSQPDTALNSGSDLYRFDQTTIKKITDLSSSETGRPLVLPENQRINPFE